MSESSSNIPASALAAQRAAWRRTVGSTILLQWAVVLGLALVALILGGERVGRSLLVGGAAVAVPNALLALWLTIRVYRFGSAGQLSMFVGEMAKLALTFGLLAALAARWKSDMSYLALIVGVIGALKAQWLALWFTRRM